MAAAADVHFFFPLPGHGAVAAPVDVPDAHHLPDPACNADGARGPARARRLGLAVLDDLADAEQLPPPLRRHMRCALLALLQEEDEARAGAGPHNDLSASRIPGSRSALLPTPSTPTPARGGWARAVAPAAPAPAAAPAAVRAGTADDEQLFQSAYCSVVSDPESLQVIAHMENMYAAAVDDLIGAQEATMERRQAWIERQQRQAAEEQEEDDDHHDDHDDHDHDDIADSKQQQHQHQHQLLPQQKAAAPNADAERETHGNGKDGQGGASAVASALIRQYSQEIEQTKREQRVGFREFVIAQHQDNMLAAAAAAAAAARDRPRPISNGTDSGGADEAEVQRAGAAGHDNEGARARAVQRRALQRATVSRSRQKLRRLQQRAGRIPAVAKQRRVAKLDAKLYASLVRHGFSAVLTENRGRVSVVSANNGHDGEGAGGGAAATRRAAGMFDDRSGGGKNANSPATASTALPAHLSHLSHLTHLSQHGTRQLLRFVACFGQQRKHTLLVELMVPEAVKRVRGGRQGISSLFMFDPSDPEARMHQRRESARRVCSHNNLSCLILPFSRDGRVDRGLSHLCRGSTDFFFASVEAQVSRGLRHHQRVAGSSVFENGAAVVTRHANLCGLQMMFHVARDSAYRLGLADGDGGGDGTGMLRLVPAEDEADAMGAGAGVVAGVASRPHPNGHAIRESLSRGVRHALKTAATNGASVVYLPCDLYCPEGQGFGTRDFGALVRDVRASVIELISRQRQQESHYLSCVRFILTSKTASRDQNFLDSLVAMLREKFAADLFQDREADE